MSGIREKVWKSLADTKVNECFSAFVVKKYQQYDLALNLFLVFSTSASVATWAIWDELDLLWAGIIGVSQLLTLAKPYFLFPKYIKIFSEKKGQWQSLTVELETLWYKINRAAINDDEAWSLHEVIRRQMTDLNHTPEDIIFFKHEKLQREAEENCNIYLINL